MNLADTLLAMLIDHKQVEAVLDIPEAAGKRAEMACTLEQWVHKTVDKKECIPLCKLSLVRERQQVRGRQQVLAYQDSHLYLDIQQGQQVQWVR